jgi:hypothetical protein
MSGVLSGAIVAAQVLVAALIRVPRYINSQHGIIIPDCIIEEVSRDTLEITDHPVELGAQISDHAFNKPREVTLRWSWSNTGRYDTFMQDQYNILAALQATREPFFIYTGKTRYQNMLIQSLGIVTDSSSEYVLNAVMICREVIIVSTSTTQVPQSAMTNPSSTAGNVGRGQISLSQGAP